MSKKSNSGMWEYLESLGILEKGTEEEINIAKKTYRKKYLLEFKQKQRIKKPEFNINFSKENGEFGKVSKEAEKHHCTITAFIHDATLAYINQSYVVPNTLQIAQLEQILSDCLNEIQTIVRFKEKYHWERDRKLETIEKRIEKLEQQINEVFRHPTLLSSTSHDHQNQVT
ncbi:MAG: hypothetical protein WAV23_02905 [Minisyncoccia bacterium]